MLDEAVQKYPDFAKVRVTNNFEELHSNQNKSVAWITLSAVKLSFIYLFIYLFFNYILKLWMMKGQIQEELNNVDNAREAYKQGVSV